MQASPFNVVIKGIVIADLLNFRYGQQLQEQRFFELKFRQPLFGSPFSFGTDDPESYNNQPIILNFEDAFGKMESVSGTIVKLEFISSPGQQAEVIVSGTMYRPSRNLSKFALFLIALLVVPCLFIGSLSWYVSRLSTDLVKTEGTVRSFQERSYKSIKNYSFKIAPYHAEFYRSYHTPFLNTASQQINALFKDDGGVFNADSISQSVKFYVFKADLAKLNNAAEKVDFLYLNAQSRPLLKFDFNYDIMVYVTNKTWFFLVWLFYLFLEVFCLICAYFCYKMYALNQQRKNRIIWWGTIVFAVILNVFVLLVVI